MQDVTHDEDVGGGERVGEEVAGIEPQPVGEPVRGDVVVEDRPSCREVQPAAGQVRVAQRELHWYASFGGADVDDGVIAIPGELLRDRPRGADAEAGHGVQELPEAALILVHREEVLACVGLVMRTAGA
jgi:hypothetical protein